MNEEARAALTHEEAAAEVAYWTERAEMRAALDASPLPVWMRARRAFLEDFLGALPAPAPSAPPVAPALPALPAAEAGAEQAEPRESDSDQDLAEDAERDQSGQPKRTREEAREAVRALLGEDPTDREIARRIGVSPSTVAAVRKATGA